MIGTVLANRYEILELIGTGGMANVYKAKCMLLNREVAIKVLKSEYSNDDDFIKRFNIESQAAAGLSHTNIVSVHDVGTENDIHYIVMEYVDGITLKKYLAENAPLDWNEAIDFATQISSALHNAHRNGVVHRDIKPQNILVTKEKVLKVTDFGIARAVSSYTMKVDDSAMGTAHYCSPEQARGGFTDERSDIYSLGIVMYEMLTGKLPFESDNSISVAIKHMQEDAIKPTDINAAIPKSLESLVLKAMEKDPNDRFQTASELFIELNFIVQTEKFEKEKVKSEQIIEEKYRKNDKKSSTENNKKNKKTETDKEKEDKRAVVAAIISSFVIVFVISFIAVASFFPNILPWNRESSGTAEVPDLIGLSYDKAVETYSNIEFIKEEEYSAEYNEGIIFEQSPEYGESIEAPFEIKVFVSKGAKEVTVPDVVNLDIEQAQKVLEKHEIEWSVEYKESNTIPEDIVISAIPGEGKTVKVNKDVVKLIISSGSEKKQIVVPNVIGKQVQSAELELSKLGLTSTVTETESEKPKGTVIKQSISAGSSVSEKALIKLTVSAGKSENNEPGNVPDNPDTPGVSDEPSVPTSTKNLTISLPSDKATVTVKVAVNGKTCYEKTHNTSEGAITVPISGTGKSTVSYYIDGTLKGERTIQF